VQAGERQNGDATSATEGDAMSNITALLERNKAFAGSGAWRNTPRLPFLPFKNLYVITCIDPRTDPADFLGLQFGDAIVARSIGGRVTDAVIRDLSYIGYLVETKAPEGPYFEAAVIHHTDCGSRLLEDPELRHGFAQRSGYDERQLAALPATVPAETARGDVAKILAAPQVSTRITVSGHVYDTATGLLETVAEPVSTGS
jgi:carbonic anhydrase